MIDLVNFSYEEAKAIEELRLRVENEEILLLDDASIYYRFLKARDFNVDKAEKMLKKHMVWRKAKQVNTILKDFTPKEVFTKCLILKCIGVDKKGDLIMYLPMGKLDGRDALKCIKFNNYMDHWIWCSEKNVAKVEELKKQTNPGTKFPQVSIIFDLDKLTFSNATSKASVEIMLGIMDFLQDNYPEGMSSLFVINAPRYYVFCFSILKTVMSNEMIQKISVFGNDGWKEALLKAVDADVLPAFLGGNRTDPDGNPLCKTIVNHGGRLPPCYYLSDEDRYFKDKDEVKTLYIPKNSSKEVYIDVKEAGLVIEWEFLVPNKDIGVGLYHENSKVTEILPVMRYVTFDGTTEGYYKTKSAGKYILLFDNSYSWMNSKEVEYTVRVVKR